MVTAGATATFTGGGTPATLDSGLTVSDPDSTTLTGATIQITPASYQTGDVLNFTAQNNISASYSGGTLTLSGTDTIAHYQTALRSITYSTWASNGDPTDGGTDMSRTIDWTVDDGTPNSATDTSTVDVVHAPPAVSAGATVTFTGGGSPVTVDSGLTVSDPDSGGMLSSATIRITSGFISGDVLNYNAQNNISAAYSGGTLILSGTDTIAHYQAALRSITYLFSPSSGDAMDGGTDTSRTIDWTVNDGTANSTTGTSTVDLIHAPPTVSAGATVTFTGGGSPATVDSGLTVSDPDSGGMLSSATIQITPAGYQAGDILNYINQNGITGSYSGGTLILSGPATLAQYQAALRSITYSFLPSNGDPTDGETDTSRTIDWTVNDGTASSTTDTSTVDVVHAPPTVSAGATVTFTGGGSPATVDSGLTVSDPDSGGMLSSATIQIAPAGYQTGDVLNFTAQNGIWASYSGGTLTLSGTATLADYQTALRSITYSFSPSNDDPTDGETDTSRTIDWTVNDSVADSSTVTSALDVVNPPRHVVVSSTPLVGQTSGVASLGPITVTLEDAFDSPMLAPAGGITVTLSSSSAGGVFSATAGGSPTTILTIPAGDETASFYYGDAQTGTPTITISADGLAGATQIETLDQPAAITSDDHAAFTTTGPGSFTVKASGSPAPSLSETGRLPNGVTFTDDGDGTATLAGTPAPGSGGTYEITINAANGVSPAATQSFTLTVEEPPTASITTPGTGEVYTVGQTVSTKFACTDGAGGPGISSCTDSGGATGGSGTLDTTRAGDHTYTVTATSNDGLSVTTSVAYTVEAPTPPPPTTTTTATTPPPTTTTITPPPTTSTPPPATTAGTPSPTPAPVTSTTPATTPAAAAPVTATKVSTTTATVTWCRGSGCEYPATRLRFHADRAGTLKLVLSAKVDGRWRQVATTDIHAHRGENGLRLAGRWHGQLVPARQVRLQIQIKRTGHWRTQKSLLLTVRHKQA